MLDTLQLNLIRSHSVGVGEPLSPAVLRLMLALKAGSLARGHSGVREVVIDTLIAVHNAGLVPYVPSQGSVGASGDLAPLAHMTLALLGEGEMWVEGRRRPAAAALQQAGIAPLRAGRQGRAGADQRHADQHRAGAARPVCIRAGAAGRAGGGRADGGRGAWQRRAFRSAHSRAARPAGPDRRRAATTAHCCTAAQIRKSHLEGDDRVQDPYSLRCQPQVVGACLDQLRHAARVLLCEANAVTDNPLVFAAAGGQPDAMISGGNFHAEPVALAADGMALAIAEVGAIAERRIAMLIDTGVSRLPPFLTADAGLNSGFMIAHVTAAALASENKSMAHPASVDSLPTSANQEDHVSMATFAARRLQPMIHNTAHILGIEFLAAAQGIEFLRPLRSSAVLEAAHALLRAKVPAMAQDRYLAPDIEAATRMVSDGELARILQTLPELPSLGPNP